MERFALKTLKNWKNKPHHKPMIIHGVRQVGKTWIMREFGRRHYKNIAYIGFEKNPRMLELFAADMDIGRIIMGLELETGIKIEPKNTLIIFDEIQECPNALTSLKYFNENAPDYDILAADSHLGITLHEGESFPVGKVEFMDLYPMGYCEFLSAMGENNLCSLLEKQDWKLINVFRDKFISFLKMYYSTGGMPEAVLEFSENRDFQKVRKIQENILESYEQDFSKHIPLVHLPKIRQIWASIPSQLAKENKKFIYKKVQKGGTASVFEIPLDWLENAKLVHRISRVSKPSLPLKAYENTGAFKLFLCDIGLLSAMSLLDAKTILEGDTLFTEFKGALTEQYVCQEMKLLENSRIAYWTNDSATAEMDFLLQLDSRVMPVEVKASVNLKAKSLKVYREKFRPETEIRTSLSEYRKTGNLYDIPLYAVNGFRTITATFPDHSCQN